MTTLGIDNHVTLAKETFFFFKIFYVTHTVTYNDIDSLFSVEIYRKYKLNLYYQGFNTRILFQIQQKYI